MYRGWDESWRISIEISAILSYIIYEKFCDKESKEWDPMEGSNGMLVERSILGNFCDNKTQKYLDST